MNQDKLYLQMKNICSSFVPLDTTIKSSERGRLVVQAQISSNIKSTYTSVSKECYFVGLNVHNMIVFYVCGPNDTKYLFK